MLKFPGLRPASPAPTPCKICGGASGLFGVVDFNKHGDEQRGGRLPLSGVAVYYRRCSNCGFLFTDAFDDWSIEDFRSHIYNDGYGLADPDYADSRPRANADFVESFWGEIRGNLRVLDYGGGNDAFCAALRQKGFATAVSYDPIVPERAQRPDGKFDLVTCFETLEHMPDPLDGIAKIVDCAAEPGLICYSTIVLPNDLEKCGLDWWYVAPRNGHVSMFSQQALTAAWGRFGYKTVSFNPSTHFAFRTLPSYLAMLQGQAENVGCKGGTIAA
jgi:SAM-dependent methyltransferase